jgi:hypothetical protein
VAITRELLRHGAEAVRRRGEVDVDRPGHEIAEEVDRLGEAKEVVVDVAEVALGLRRHPGELSDAAEEPPEQVALGPDRPPKRRQPPPHREDVLEMTLARAAQHLVLDQLEPL